MSGYTGSGSAFDVTRLRRMTAEVGSTTYTDAMLLDSIRRYPVDDVDGYEPDEDGWTATYDMALAASEIWEEKAASMAANFSFDADGATFQRQQQYEHYVAQARLWKGRRVPGTWQAETYTYGRIAAPWVGNWNDPYE